MKNIFSKLAWFIKEEWKIYVLMLFLLLSISFISLLPAKALGLADRRGLARFVSMQDQYNLLEREEELFLHHFWLITNWDPSQMDGAVAFALLQLVAGLTREGRFLTPYGLATESPRSPAYVLVTSSPASAGTT